MKQKLLDVGSENVNALIDSRMVYQSSAIMDQRKFKSVMELCWQIAAHFLVGIIILNAIDIVWSPATMLKETANYHVCFLNISRGVQKFMKTANSTRF